MEQLIGAFNLQKELVIGQMFNYMLLLVILTKLVYKPIFDVLDERRRAVETSLQKAEEIDQRMENLQQYHEQQLIKARDEAQGIIAQARATTDKEKEARIAKAQEEISLLFKRAQKEISAKKQEMEKDVEQQITKLLIPAIEKILQEIVDEPIRKQIQERSVQKVAQLYNQ